MKNVTDLNEYRERARRAKINAAIDRKVDQIAAGVAGIQLTRDEMEQYHRMMDGYND